MHDDVILLASGPSINNYDLRDLEQHGHLIAISASALYTKPHVAFSMDRRAAEMCYPIWKTQGIPEIWLREGTTQNIVVGANTTLYRHDGNSPTTMTFTHGLLNGSNSGTCAFNLALQRAKKRIFMLGYDMCRMGQIPYWHPTYPWNAIGASKDGNLRAWAAEYENISEQVRKKGIEVFNVNHRSALEVFPKITYDEFLRMT